MKKFFFPVLIISILFAFVTCAKKDGRKGPYLAKVGKETITTADFEKELKALPEFAQKIFEGGSGKEKFLEELIKKELLYQEALTKGLEKDKEYLKKIEDFKKITLLGVLLEKEIETKADVTDQEVKNYYETHKQEIIDKKTGKVVEFEKVKNLIFQHLSGEKQKEIFDSYIESLKKKYNVDINKESLAKLSSEEDKEKAVQEKPGTTGEPKETPKQETKESAEKKK
ncbi:MAG: hypothetical protein A2Y97_03465 [Nitrospirae bacterium RBG_13_39_12]|nr:MAG: hypothetical protein A2Y97_03465 [Nitrospirae bacterium RBG_13_39_12]